MFGIGTPELLVILVVALVVVGPERLPELGRTIGRALREFRKVQDEVKDMVQTGIGSDFDDVRTELKGAADELRRTSDEITGGMREAADVTPLLPKKRGPRARGPGAVLGGLAGRAKTAEPSSPSDAAPAEAGDPEREAPSSGSDAASAD